MHALATLEKHVVHHPWLFAGCLLAWLAILAGALLAAGWIILRLPPGKFDDDAPPPRPRGVVAWARFVAKNVFGVVLVLGGLFLALPGIPGPGLLVIAAGLLVVDFPGKVRLERSLVRRPKVLRQLNAFRRRHGREPFRI